MSSVVALKGSPRIRSVGVGSDGTAAPCAAAFGARYAALTFAASFARSRACLPFRFFFTGGSLTAFAFFLDGGFAAASAARLSARAFVWTMERWRERARLARAHTSASSARGYMWLRSRDFARSGTSLASEQGVEAVVTG